MEEHSDQENADLGDLQETLRTAPQSNRKKHELGNEVRVLLRVR